MQSGGIVAGSALVAGVDFPTRALAAGVPVEQVPAWLDLLARAISQSQTDEAPVTLTATEFTTLRAVVGRLIPSDDLGPGADEAGVHIFIDRGLAGPNAAALPVYKTTLAALDAAARGDGFASVTTEQQDGLLTRFEAGELADVPKSAFALVLEHTREGMFGDPIYGGNKNFVGWDLIGYPGIKLVWSEADQKIDAVITPQHISVKQFGGVGW
jgi:hypothetical protein